MPKYRIKLIETNRTQPWSLLPRARVTEADQYKDSIVTCPASLLYVACTRKIDLVLKCLKQVEGFHCTIATFFLFKRQTESASCGVVYFDLKFKGKAAFISLCSELTAKEILPINGG